MTREQKIRETRRLRALGWTAPAIGKQLGVPESTIRNWYLGGDCIDCDAPVERSGRTRPGDRCRQCASAYQHSLAIWTREAVISAIQAWTRQHGRIPKATEWLHAAPGVHPTFSNVYRNPGARNAPFSSWNEAIRAAGFTPIERGRHIREGEIGLSSLGRRLLQRLRSNGAIPLRLSDIVRDLDSHYNSTWYSLRRLCERGLVVRVGRGLYAATVDVAERVT